jgi:hypothetical protein
LRQLNDIIAIPLYACFEIWDIVLSGTAGPVAVAVGTNKTGAEASDRVLQIAFGVVVVGKLSLSLLGTVWKLWDPLTSIWALIPKRRMVSDRQEIVVDSTSDGEHYTSTKRDYWELEVPDCFGGVLLSTLASIVFCLLVVGFYFGLVMAFGAGLTAMAMKLLAENGEAPPPTRYQTRGKWWREACPNSHLSAKMGDCRVVARCYHCGWSLKHVK